MKEYIVTVLLLVLFTNLARAEAFKVSSDKVDEIQIIGFEGDVQVKATDKNVVQVRTTIDSENPEDWQLIKKLEGKTLFIELQSFLDQREVSERIQQNKYPKVNIVLNSPSKNLQVYLRKGVVNLINWQSDANLEGLHTNVTTKDTKGELKVSNQTGSVSVNDHVGNLKLDTYSARVDVNKLNGASNIQNFSGVTKVVSSETNMNLSAQKGSVVLDATKGKLDFDNLRASIRLNNFEGGIRGQSGQGDFEATIIGKADVRVRSKEGKVKVQTKSSGAFINVGSKEGALYTPRHLKLTRYANIKVINGHLRGANPGRIFVRTESGAVTVR